MKNSLTKIFKYLWNNSIVITASLGIFISPFVVDYSTLPKGFELPKVFFLVVVSAIIIVLGLIKYFEKTYLKKSFIFNNDFFILLALVIVSIISTIISPHMTVAIYGNSFRDQGLITHLFLILATYVLYKSVNAKNFKVIATAFILSAIIQSGIAYGQTLELAKTDPKSLLDGLWVNGTFGQANFFSGRLMLGLIFIAYYIGKYLKNRLSFLIKYSLFLSSFFIVGALLCSLSVWGIITTAAAFITILLYELLPRKIFKYIFYIAFVLIALLGALYINTITSGNLRVEIWKNISRIMFIDPTLKFTLFGYGFDTLGYVFRDWGMFKGILIDRAHNFFFDLLFQTGVLGLAITSVILSKPLFVLRRKLTDRIFVYVFLALFFWLFRSFVHESGIVNIFDFLVVLASTLAFCKEIKNYNVELNVDLSKIEIPEIDITPDEEPAV